MPAGSRMGPGRVVTSSDLGAAGSVVPTFSYWHFPTVRTSAVDSVHRMAHPSLEESGSRATSSKFCLDSWFSPRTTRTNAVCCVGWLEPWSVYPEDSQVKSLQLATALGLNFCIGSLDPSILFLW